MFNTKNVFKYECIACFYRSQIICLDSPCLLAGNKNRVLGFTTKDRDSDDMNLEMRKSVVEVFDQVRLKPAYSASETS